MTLFQEKRAIAELQAILQDQLSIDKSSSLRLQSGSENLNPSEITELEKRNQYLRYGYGARTRACLERVYPHTKCIMGEEDWHFFGRKFALEYAQNFVNLNEIGYAFPDFLNRMSVGVSWVESALVELDVLRASVSAISSGIEPADFAGFSGRELLSLQPNVYFRSVKLRISEHQWQKSETVANYVIFRDSNIPRGPVRIVFLRPENFAILLSAPNMTIAELIESNPDTGAVKESLAFGLNNGLFSDAG